VDLEMKLKKEEKRFRKLKKAIDDAGLTDKEVAQLTRKLEKPNVDYKVHQHRWSKKRSKLGVISDTHIGHEKFRGEDLLKAFKFFEKKGVHAIYHVGDILEGMSGRDGQIYELSHIGADAQISYAEKLFKETKLPVYAITGNHDEWYMKKANIGLDIGKELEKRVPNYHHLGNSEADVKLAKNTVMKLFHANDGTAYAMSYKGQKLIESLSGGEKPNIILSGHYHKALSMFVRNVFHFEAGTLCGQTGWMRGKKIDAHMGYWYLEIYHDKAGVERIVSEFVPIYEK